MRKPVSWTKKITHRAVKFEGGEENKIVYEILYRFVLLSLSSRPWEQM